LEQRADDGLPSEALPKAKRLAKRREFLRVYETGRKNFSRFTVVFVAPNGLAHSRVGVTVTRKVGKANVRNRLKRWVREIYRRQREPLALDARTVDFVVNLKPNAVTASYRDFNQDLSRLLRRIAAESAE
jgi:ribonuclease P protein component